MRTPKKSKSSLRAAFVVTASFGASLAACGGSLVGGADENGGGGAGGDGTAGETGNPTPCPGYAPPDGDPCFGNTVCDYQNGCGDEIDASCVDGAWVVVDHSFEVCNPPAPCPDELPVEGEYCDNPGYFGGPYGCEFTVDTPCGPQDIIANCGDHPQLGLVWVFDVQTCTSNAAACGGYDSEWLCRADTACRWLAPACTDPDEAEPGACYPIDDCAADTCAADEACTVVSFDPCWGSEECKGCTTTADASVCRPVP